MPCHHYYPVLKGSPDELSSLPWLDGIDQVRRCGGLDPLFQRMAMPPLRRSH
jgi:hypothetical protein